MKRPAIILFFFLPCLGSGQVFELSVFNDSWAGGFTTIRDDLRTYGFDVGYRSAGDWSVTARYSALTNQYTEQIADRIRADEIYLKAEVPLIRFPLKGDYFGAAFGVYFTGKMFGDRVQNSVHRLFGVRPVELPFIDPAYRSPFLGWIFRKKLVKHPINQEYSLRLGVDLSGEYAPNYRFTTQWTLPLSLESDENRAIALKVGYVFLHSSKDNDLLSRVFAAESGWRLNLRFNFNYLFFYYDFYPSQEFSNGGFGFRLKTASSPDWSNVSRLTVTIGLLTRGAGIDFQYKWRLPNQWRRQLRILVGHSFNTSYLRTYPLLLNHANTVSLGAEIHLLNDHLTARAIQPYLNVLFGRRNISAYSGRQTKDKMRFRQFTAINDMGIKFRLEWRAFHRPQQLNFSIFHRLQYFSPIRNEKLLLKDQDRFASWQSRFGGAFTFFLAE